MAPTTTAHPRCETAAEWKKLKILKPSPSVNGGSECGFMRRWACKRVGEREGVINTFMFVVCWQLSEVDDENSHKLFLIQTYSNANKFVCWFNFEHFACERPVERKYFFLFLIKSVHFHKPNVRSTPTAWKRKLISTNANFHAFVSLLQDLLFSICISERKPLRMLITRREWEREECSANVSWIKKTPALTRLLIPFSSVYSCELFVYALWQN